MDLGIVEMESFWTLILNKIYVVLIQSLVFCVAFIGTKAKIYIYDDVGKVFGVGF